MEAKILKNTLAAALAIGMIALVTVLSLMPPDGLPRGDWWFRRIPNSDKIVHFFFYFGMISAIRFAKTVISGYTKACPWRLLVFAAVYGGVIELLQGAYFGRGCEVWDEVANVLGAAAAIWAIPQRWHDKTAEKLGRKK